MSCIVVFAKADSQEKADEIVYDLLKKKLILCADVIETKNYSITSSGSIKSQTEYLLIAKTHKDLISQAKKQLLKHISFEKGDLVIFNAMETSARLDMLLDKLTK